jgi:hypothetical protein
MQALRQMEAFKSETQELISEYTATPVSQLRFITDAWMQVRAQSHCRTCLLGCMDAHSCIAWHVAGRGLYAG